MNSTPAERGINLSVGRVRLRQDVGYACCRLRVASFAARLRRRSTGPPAARAAASVANVAGDAKATIPSLQRITYPKRSFGSGLIARRNGRSLLCKARRRMMPQKVPCLAFGTVTEGLRMPTSAPSGLRDRQPKEGVCRPSASTMITLIAARFTIASKSPPHVGAPAARFRLQMASVGHRGYFPGCLIGRVETS
jgi:hypothetical protein